MNSQEKYDFCVVGAGPSGLTISHQLAKRGASVLLLERERRTGGLAKSYDYNGHIFDIGPKRFHTEDPAVLSFLREVSDGAMLSIPRSTEVHFLDRYFDWPLRLQNLFRMPVGISVQAILDLLRKSEAMDNASFREYIQSKYGRTLYDTFFEPYTGKFLRWNVEDVHSDWATTGINRSIIDKRVRGNTLIDLLKTLLLPSKVDTTFLYPARGGFGGFFEDLLSRFADVPGCRVGVHEEIATLSENSGGIDATTTQSRSFRSNALIWSGNLNDLLRIIGSPLFLPYLNTVFYNVICREEGVRHTGAQWIYVSRGDSLISRITSMKEFGGYTCRPGYYNFICEVTDSQSKPLLFQAPRSRIEHVLQEAIDIGFLGSRSCVEEVHVNPVQDTYPIYHRGYREQFDSASAAVRRFSDRIHLLGRCGAYWYNNSDHSIRFAIEMARKLLGETTADFDYRAYFGGA